MISIIILNYKAKGLLKNCLNSIYRYTENLDFEIIVVDNNSKDGVKKMLETNFSKVKFIQAKKNLGFSKGNNLGIKKAQGKYLVIINPDTTLIENSFKKMRDFMEEHKDIGIIGPQLINPDRSIQYTRCNFPEFLMPIYRRSFLKKINYFKKKIDLYLTKDKDYNQTIKTDWIFGACLFVRKEAIDKVGLLDERFFLGFEDLDWCKRFWQYGYEVWYFPKTKIIHYPHRFSKKGLLDKTIRIHIASWLKYFWKYRKK